MNLTCHFINGGSLEIIHVPVRVTKYLFILLNSGILREEENLAKAEKINDENRNIEKALKDGVDPKAAKSLKDRFLEVLAPIIEKKSDQVESRTDDEQIDSLLLALTPLLDQRRKQEEEEEVKEEKKEEDTTELKAELNGQKSIVQALLRLTNITKTLLEEKEEEVRIDEEKEEEAEAEAKNKRDKERRNGAEKDRSPASLRVIDYEDYNNGFRNDFYDDRNYRSRPRTLIERVASSSGSRGLRGNQALFEEFVKLAIERQRWDQAADVHDIIQKTLTTPAPEFDDYDDYDEYLDDIKVQRNHPKKNKNKSIDTDETRSAEKVRNQSSNLDSLEEYDTEESVPGGKKLIRSENLGPQGSKLSKSGNRNNISKSQSKHKNKRKHQPGKTEKVEKEEPVEEPIKEEFPEDKDITEEYFAYEEEDGEEAAYEEEYIEEPPRPTVQQTTTSTTTRRPRPTSPRKTSTTARTTTTRTTTERTTRRTTTEATTTLRTTTEEPFYEEEYENTNESEIAEKPVNDEIPNNENLPPREIQDGRQQQEVNERLKDLFQSRNNELQNQESSSFKSNIQPESDNEDIESRARNENEDDREESRTGFQNVNTRNSFNRNQNTKLNMDPRKTFPRRPFFQGRRSNTEVPESKYQDGNQEENQDEIHDENQDTNQDENEPSPSNISIDNNESTIPGIEPEVHEVTSLRATLETVTISPTLRTVELVPEPTSPDPVVFLASLVNKMNKDLDKLTSGNNKLPYHQIVKISTV